MAEEVIEEAVKRRSLASSRISFATSVLRAPFCRISGVRLCRFGLIEP
jgi:hypothetical protein